MTLQPRLTSDNDFTTQIGIHKNYGLRINWSSSSSPAPRPSTWSDTLRNHKALFGITKKANIDVLWICYQQTKVVKESITKCNNPGDQMNLDIISVKTNNNAGSWTDGTETNYRFGSCLWLILLMDYILLTLVYNKLHG
jgi:hypothetical protein